MVKGKGKTRKTVNVMSTDGIQTVCSAEEPVGTETANGDGKQTVKKGKLAGIDKKKAKHDDNTASENQNGKVTPKSNARSRSRSDSQAQKNDNKQDQNYLVKPSTA